MVRVVDKVAMTVASIIKKYENGKCRALYPTTLDHYLAESYSIGSLEAKLNEQPDIGISSDPEKAMIQTAVMLQDCLNKKTAWCWDFDNFNQSHSRSDQHAVFNQQARCAEDIMIESDYK